MNIIEPWLERDLTAEAKAGKLERAFEVDQIVNHVGCLIDSGHNPILAGEHGVGKTAVIYELVCRARAGRGPARLARRRVLQLSIERRASALRDRFALSEEMYKLIDALRGRGGKFALFFRDIDSAYSYDLEPQLSALAYAFDGPLLGEGTESGVSDLLEDSQLLQRHFMAVRIDEPSLDQSRRIVRAGTNHRRSLRKRAFSESAIEQAIHLSHRFLARSRLPRKAFELLDQAAAQSPKGSPVTDADVIDRFCSVHQTPRALVDPAIPLDLDRLATSFKTQVVGQDEAVESVVRMIGVMKAGLSDLRRPLGVFLFVGPTGVGKTYVAQLLAEHLFGHRDRLVRFNMADFPQETDPDRLFGDPDEVTKEKRRGLLTKRLMGLPFGVVLLDEFEKANPRVHDRFLQLFDEGMFINGAGEANSCRSLIVIATSNAGWDTAGGEPFGFAGNDTARREDLATAALEKHFRGELLNRVDRLIQFLPLQGRDIEAIATQEIARLRNRIGIEQRDLTIVADQTVIDWVLLRGYDERRGARSLHRIIERFVTTALADVIVRKNPKPGSTITLTVRDGRIVACLNTDGCRDKGFAEIDASATGALRVEAAAQEVPEESLAM